MQEDFLHYLWRLKRFDFSDLRTTQGDAVVIHQCGEYNTHAGPDFLNARIRIGATLWAGNVEMHLRASDWRRHRHQDDAAYDNVILHVVLEEDEPVVRSNGERLPCLELRKRIPAGVAAVYRKLMHNACWIPCQPHFRRVSDLTRQLWLDRLLVERLEERTASIRRCLEHNTNDWEETFHQQLARCFGFRINAQPFEELARAIPLRLIRRHRDKLCQVEALLFGQAGFLQETLEGEYPQRLRREYLHLSRKYDLSPMPVSVWKFLRLRPANFPTLRIAQFCTLLCQSEHLFGKMLAARDVAEIENMFEVRLSNYWKEHFLFGKASPRRKKALGRPAIHHIIINAIAPFLFLYGSERKESGYQDRALSLLEALPPEDNREIRHWRELGMVPESAYESQALLQLKKRYCQERGCLRCAIGHAILSGGDE